MSPGFDLDRRLQRLGLDGSGLEREGYVEEERLWQLMAAADVHVNLRSPTMGETSGTAIRALSLGKPLIVSDVGWFSELPDEVALKVPVDDREVATLVAALELLGSRPDVRLAMGEAARELARREHDVDLTAERYVAAFEQAVGGSAGERRRAARRERGGGGSRDRAGIGGGPRDRRDGLPRSTSVGERLRAVPAWAWLAAIVLCSFVGPGLALAAHAGAVHHDGRADVLGARPEPRRGALARDPRVPAQRLRRLYPLLIAPAYALFDSLTDAYAAVKVINSLTMSLAAYPPTSSPGALPEGASALLAALLACRCRRSSTRRP